MASSGTTNKHDHDDCPACRHAPLYDTEVYRAVLAAEYPHLVRDVGGRGNNTDTVTSLSTHSGNHQPISQPSVATVPDHHDSANRRCIVYWLVLAFLMQLPLFGIAFREQQRLRNLQRHPPHETNPHSPVPPPVDDAADIDHNGDHDSSNMNNTATTMLSANLTTTGDENSTSSCDDFLVQYYPSWQALEEETLDCAENSNHTCRICPSDDDRDDQDDFIASPRACDCFCRHELQRTAVYYDAATKCCQCGAAAAGNP
jgi:hypothetical protein